MIVYFLEINWDIIPMVREHHSYGRMTAFSIRNL